VVTLAAQTTDTPVWWLFGATATLALFAFLALRQVREIARDRHIQVISEFGLRWDEPRLWRARQKQIQIPNDEVADMVRRWYTERDPEAADVPLLLRVPNFFEDLALMVEIGNLEIPSIGLWMGDVILKMWEYWQPSIVWLQLQVAPTSYVRFAWLVRELKAIEAEWRN
jgi:hypothetical protein